MRFYLAFVVLLLYHVSGIWSRPSEGEDGFRRLLRRSALSDKFDRPLIREERGIEDDFENLDDTVITRNRRSNEDKFYQTLLSRTESKQQDKRSFDTEDSDNKAGFIIREDWTGDSKISDADRQELENLFNTLNPAEEEEVKNDEIREINIEDEPGAVQGAAKDYTSWLMQQQPAKFTKSLTHKVEVDHHLSKMFYKSSLPAVTANVVKGNARFGITQLPAVCNDNSPHCLCMRACAPRPVTSATPCNCGMPAPPPPPPAPAAVRASFPKAFTKPCDPKDAKCLCARSCYPRPVANAKPCDCGMPPAPAPAPPPASMQYPKAGSAKQNCRAGDAKCLCTKSCHPRPVAKYSPCDCGMPPAPAPAPPPASFQAAKVPACRSNDAKCLCTRKCHPKRVAKFAPCDCEASPAPAPAPPPASLQAPAQYQAQAAKSAAAGCKPTDAKCLCARACHPRPVSRVSPCDCGMPPPPAPAPPPAGLKTSRAAPNTPSAVGLNCNPKDAKCICAKSCHPRPVAKYAPCDCGMPAPPPPPPPSKFANHPCNPADAKCICTRACYPRPVAKTSPCNCGMPPAPPPSPPPPPQATSSKSADAKSYTPAVAPAIAPAVAWCTKACQPRHVLTSNPCQCHPTEPEKAPIRPAKPVPQARDNADTMCAKSCHPRPVSSSNPCSCGLPSADDKEHKYPIAAPNVPLESSAPASAPASTVEYQQYIQPKTDSQAPARSAVSSKTEKKAESKAASNIQSALSDTASLAKDEYFDKNGEKLTYLNTRAKNYQGCYKDKKPGRDLPRRFTRYAMTPEVCLRECKYQGYKFAGLQYSYLCFCGNAFGRYGKVDDSFCNSRCLGDNNRPCGAFWHNSIYSADAREFDATDFDFKKVDAEEAKKDAVTQQQGIDLNKYSSSAKANVANNLVKAAEAALKAARTLLPDSKNKAQTRKYKGGKHKREDDEDPALEEMKMSAMASLKAAKRYLRKTQVVDPGKHKPKEKRSIEVGDDSWVNLDNGKDLLVAYLGGIADYRRQTRSVDDEDEDDLESSDDKPKFEYRRMTLGASGDGEFINRYDDDATKPDDKKKRSVDDGDFSSDEVVKMLLPISGVKTTEEKTLRMNKRDLVDATVDNSTAKVENATTANSTQASNSTAEGLEVNKVDSNKNDSCAGARCGETNTTVPSVDSSPVLANTSLATSNTSLATANTSLPVNVTLNKVAGNETTADVKSITVSEEKSISIRKRRSLDEEEDPEVDGVKKMAARGEHAPDAKPMVQAEVKRQVNEDSTNEDVSESDFARLLNEETDAENSVEKQVKRSSRDAENHDVEDDFTSSKKDKEPKVEKRSTENLDKKEHIQLRSHVEKGVEKLMALVINLYKEQSTIKGFEDSVHDLKDDIATELKVSPDKRDEIMKQLRTEIQSTAADKLKDLTSTIRTEIKTFAKSHPATDKKADTAIRSIPDLPVTDADYSRARREISKRGAELDDVENQFETHEVPGILKEHFKRNAEETKFKGERMLSRNHRNVPEDDQLDDELSEIIES